MMIYWFSFHSGIQSNSQSGIVKRILETFFRKTGIGFNKSIFLIFAPFCKEKVTAEVFVRKCAHIFEYFIFGTVCTTAAIHWRKRKFLRFLPLIFGITTALQDEMVIQRFLVTGRTYALTDVLLDSIGFYFAVFLIAVIFGISVGLRRVKSRS